ncbi:peroxisomal membrane protein PEX13 isoform X2 [Topomyia yanbarensis]|uniref:peroxisomal membrane protein PEX13 isoform X2 n=1 Tax=Topomyia yanbarensis TaxID=2498891 RepID=UPI00273CB231|nr:peroxisomal membrane protein PEX13 isoform X2 [Topomyia yanbarensis]
MRKCLFSKSTGCVAPFQQSSGTGMYANAYGTRFGMPPYGYSGLSNGYSMFGNNMMNDGMYGGGYGFNPPYPEHRFIQMAEESSRPTFQSIESLVGAISNIATMLDSTFFALTSSFRAVLGVAANFAHLRGVFAQFWTSFALFRWIVWSYRKLLFLLKITKTDPTENNFKEAFKMAKNDKQATSVKGSSLPVILFLGFIMSAPYLLMKLFGSSEHVERTKNPHSWVNPLEAVALFNFDSTNPEELTIRAGQQVLIAPKTVQVEQNLLNTGWVLASIDNTTSGLIPVSYVQGSQRQQILAPVFVTRNTGISDILESTKVVIRITYTSGSMAENASGRQQRLMQASLRNSILIDE